MLLTGSSCSAVIDGTAADADNGYVHFDYYNPTKNVDGGFYTVGGRHHPDGNLRVYDVTGSGCENLLHDGDQVSLGLGFTVANGARQSPLITSP